jgi:outer membrane lipoprotein carrier protein
VEKLLAIVSCQALLWAAGDVARLPGRGPGQQAAAQNVPYIVRSLETRYHAAATLKAAFLERYSESRRAVRTESGTVYFSRPGRMRWEYESPEAKLFIADGRIVWFYVPADRTVTRARMRESTDWRTPLALLTGKAKLSRLCSRIELADQPSVVAGHVVLRCFPRGRVSRVQANEPDDVLNPAEGNESFREVLLEVDTSRNELVRLLVRQPGDVETEYRFANWQQNLPLPEAMFHFETPAGVAIVDESSLVAPTP